MDIQANVQKDLVDTLSVGTENLQYNQEDSHGSFGVIFQDHLEISSFVQANNRQIISANRQEFSFEDQDIIYENHELITDELEKILIFAVSIVDDAEENVNEFVTNKSKEIEQDLLVQYATIEQPRPIPLNETALDNAHVVFLKNNAGLQFKNNLKFIVQHNDYQEKITSDASVSFVNATQEFDVFRQEETMRSLNLSDNIFSDVNKNENNLEFKENNIEEQSESIRKFEEIMTKAEQEQQVFYAKPGELKEDLDKTEVKISENNVDNNLNSSYNLSNQKIMNYQGSHSNSQESADFKIKNDYIENSIFDEKWGKYFGDKLLSLSFNGNTQAVIHIEPAELGPVDVRIELNKEKTSISFTSHHAQVREILENSALKLKELFLEQGHTHLEVNVSDKENRDSFFEERTYKAKHQRVSEAAEEDCLFQNNRSDGLIDYYI